VSAAIDAEHIESLKRSFELVGPIYPIVEDKENGKEVSGRHRSLTGKPWPRVKRRFKDNFQRELFILLSNTQRQPSEEESRFRLNRVAMEYWILHKCEEGTVCARLTELLGPHDEQSDGTVIHVPMWKSARWIEHLLEDRWKGNQGPKKTEVTSISDGITSKVNQIKKIKTALEDQISALDEQPQYPYPECKCPTCDRKTECGY
jgi:hypothetical protein